MYTCAFQLFVPFLSLLETQRPSRIVPSPAECGQQKLTTCTSIVYGFDVSHVLGRGVWWFRCIRMQNRWKSCFPCTKMVRQTIFDWIFLIRNEQKSRIRSGVPHWSGAPSHSHLSTYFLLSLQIHADCCPVIYNLVYSRYRHNVTRFKHPKVSILIGNICSYIKNYSSRGHRCSCILPCSHFYGRTRLFDEYQDDKEFSTIALTSGDQCQNLGLNVTQKRKKGTWISSTGFIFLNIINSRQL